ncbi:MAG: 1,4-alpha-glucan branching protein GlgB [Ruminococcus sp.]|nr:1,4-alpha-glucan branching protein GlgB [Ruminococcus sp.]
MAYTLNDERYPLDQFLAGDSVRAYEFLGSHFVNWDNRNGVVFRVWAPNALSVSVVGDFNDWNRDAHYMYRISDSGVWELFIENVQEFDRYKYCVETSWQERFLKTDPYAFHCELRPDNASRVYNIDGYEWHDEAWYQYKKEHPHKSQPINVYEMNAGSWRKSENGDMLSYRQLADELIPYVKNMGYTHIEFMPLTEFPFDGSWGYQVTGYYAATSRYGEPKDLMYFIDKCHENGIGVILDWVPAHFPKDAHGLARFDGTGCYEYEDWRIGEHKEWGTYIFNYGRYEVKSFLVSSAMFWLDMFHIDGIRVDAVASMLYLDYNRKDGEWIPNMYGGRENLVAVDFLQNLNTAVHLFHPEAMMIAEESTAWPSVTGYPVEGMGLGFDYKWNMGWMNDMLSYISTDPLWRNYHHDTLTFSMVYAFSENFMLPISHDEVVYGKGSLINKMPGDYDRKFAGVRGFVSYMMAHPGKKLMFMGGEIGQFDEWNSNEQLEWNLFDYDKHRELNHFFAEVNKFYRDVPAMHENDYDWDGFQWVALDDYQNSVIAFRRIANDGSEILVVCNFQPVQRDNYRIGVPVAGTYEEVFNSESTEFGGCGVVNSGEIKSSRIKDHELNNSIEITLPPLGVMYFKLKKKAPAPRKSTSKMEQKKKEAVKKVKAEKTEKTEKTEKAEKEEKVEKAE